MLKAVYAWNAGRFERAVEGIGSGQPVAHVPEHVAGDLSTLPGAGLVVLGERATPDQAEALLADRGTVLGRAAQQGRESLVADVCTVQLLWSSPWPPLRTERNRPLCVGPLERARLAAFRLGVPSRGAGSIRHGPVSRSRSSRVDPSRVSLRRRAGARSESSLQLREALVLRGSRSQRTQRIGRCLEAVCVVELCTPRTQPERGHLVQPQAVSPHRWTAGTFPSGATSRRALRIADQKNAATPTVSSAGVSVPFGGTDVRCHEAESWPRLVACVVDPQQEPWCHHFRSPWWGPGVRALAARVPRYGPAAAAGAPMPLLVPAFRGCLSGRRGTSDRVGRLAPAEPDEDSARDRGSDDRPRIASGSSVLQAPADQHGVPGGGPDA